MKRAISLGLATVGLVVGIPVVAMAAIPDAAGVIHGCRNNLTRIVTVIDENQQCGLGTQPLNWNQTGPQGQQGPQGEQGPAGPGSHFYVVKSNVGVPIGSTQIGGEAACNSNADRAVGGGYGFGVLTSIWTPAVYPPKHVSVSFNQPLTIAGFDRWAVVAEYDEYQPATNYSTQLQVWVTCASPS